VREEFYCLSLAFSPVNKIFPSVFGMSYFGNLKLRMSKRSPYKRARREGQFEENIIYSAWAVIGKHHT
jgi:hypothetical protein